MIVPKRFRRNTEARGKPGHGPGFCFIGGLTDDVGALFAVWQPAAHIGADIVNEPGALAWNELGTRDIDAAKAFYGAVFGWDAEDQGPPGGPPAYTEWKLAGRSIGGMLPKQSEMPADMPPNWGVYFAVSDTGYVNSSTGQIPPSFPFDFIPITAAGVARAYPWGGSEEKYYKPDVRYRFTLDGAEHEGQHVQMDSEANLDQAEVTAVLAGQQLDNGGGFAMPQHPQHDAVVGPFHATSLQDSGHL